MIPDVELKPPVWRSSRRATTKAKLSLKKSHLKESVSVEVHVILRVFLLLYLFVRRSVLMGKHKHTD